MSPEEKIKNYFNKNQKGVKFEKNKKYFSSLTEEEEGHWVCDNPLFVSSSKGLYPVYRANGRYGILNKNYHELVMKDLPIDFYKKPKLKKENLHKSAKNILSFENDLELL
jgi:hypothetical protein